MPNLITHPHQTSIIEWYVVCRDPKNGYQKDTYLKVMGLHAQNMILTI